MPSLAESRRQVKESLQPEEDHEAILASLQDEIDRHNAIKDDLEEDIERSRRSRSPCNSERSRDRRPGKFRFKHNVKDPEDKERKRHRRRDERDREHRHRHKRRKQRSPPTPDTEPTHDEEAAHPFPREPTADPFSTDAPPDAFRASLFDALADDEGAAAYWESVYSQPIHIYPRPEVRDARSGKLEAMGDEEYVRYVKEKMWERKNPEVVFERKRRERERREQERERDERREEFLRRAWERRERRGGRAGSEGEDGDGKEGFEEVFAGEPARARSRADAVENEYSTAWTSYLNAWHALLVDRSNSEDGQPSARIPWPVLTGKPVLKPNIEAFMQRAPTDSDQSRLRTLKAERVRWHPDKVQQRFGGKVDEGTMKLVTGVFQVIDGMLEVERKNGGT